MTTRLAIGLAGMLALMGADGDGCNLGETTSEGTTGAGAGNPGDCPPGTHPDIVCDDHDCGPNEPGDCYEICVPDEVCPPDSYEEWICDEPPYPGDPANPDMGFCLDPEGCWDDPGMGECYPICVPIDMCGPGMHEEIHCDDPWDDPGMPPDPGMTSGSTVTTTTGSGMGGAYSSGYTSGSGTGGNYSSGYTSGSGTGGNYSSGYTTVTTTGTGMGGNYPPPPPECYPICVPDDDYPCPPGTYPEIECFEMDCWENCVPYPAP